MTTRKFVDIYFRRPGDAWVMTDTVPEEHAADVVQDYAEVQAYGNDAEYAAVPQGENPPM